MSQAIGNNLSIIGFVSNYCGAIISKIIGLAKQLPNGNIKITEGKVHKKGKKIRPVVQLKALADRPFKGLPICDGRDF